jgi:hypothetical protein
MQKRVLLFLVHSRMPYFFFNLESDFAYGASTRENKVCFNFGAQVQFSVGARILAGG